MHTLCTVVGFRKYRAGRCGNAADFRKIAIIHFAVQLLGAHVIGIGQRNVQSRRIVPAVSVRTDTFLHRCRKRRRLRINHRHLHAVLFADISQVVCKSDYIFSVFRHGKAVPDEGRPCGLSLHPVLSCLNAAAAISCAVSLFIIDCRTMIRSTGQLDRARFPVCRYGAFQLFQLRRLIVNGRHKCFCPAGIAILIRHLEYIDAVFRHSTGSGGNAGNKVSRLCAARCVYGRDLACTGTGSLLRRPGKHSALFPCRRVARYGNRGKSCSCCRFHHIIGSRPDDCGDISRAVCNLYMKIFCGLCSLRGSILCLISAIRIRGEHRPCGWCRCRSCPRILHLCHTAAAGILRKHGKGQFRIYGIRSRAAAAPNRDSGLQGIYFLYLNGLGNHVSVAVRQCDGIRSVFRDLQICRPAGCCDGF